MAALRMPRYLAAFLPPFSPEAGCIFGVVLAEKSGNFLNVTLGSASSDGVKFALKVMLNYQVSLSLSLSLSLARARALSL